jgi:hypothetical protein
MTDGTLARIPEYSAELVAGGAVPLSSSAYVPRQFVDDCLRFVGAGDWVTLLGPRQHGKTSGLLRLHHELAQDGFYAVLVDLQNYSTRSSDDVASFYKWLVAQVRRRLHLPEDVDLGGVSDDLEAALEVAFSGLGTGEVVVLIDEAASLHYQTRLVFFSQLRALHTAIRGGMSALDRRIQFVFSGTFRPDTVIDDDNSPFNVSRIVITSDLTIGDVELLAVRGGGATLQGWSSRVFDAVGGQPYLVQCLLRAVSQGSPDDAENLFSAELTRLESGFDGHLPSLMRRLSSEPGADQLLQQVVATGETGLVTSGTGLGQFLQIVGATSLEDQSGVLRLRVRNALYNRVFMASSVINPDDVLREEPGTNPGPVIIVPIPSSSLEWIQDERLRIIVHDSHTAAVTLAHNAHYRLALSALGSAYEGMLRAFLEQMDDAERCSLRAQAKRPDGRDVAGGLNSWDFAAMVAVAHQSAVLFDVSRGNSDLVRDWRNYIHPDRARSGFQAEGDLRPEVRFVDASIEKLVQVMNRLTT